MPLKLEPLSKSELDWVASHVEAAPGFVAAFSPSDAEANLSLATLDRAFAAWLAQGSTDDAEINAMVNLVGVTFGSFLVRDAGFEWVIATDEQGSDLAVVALPGSADLLVYPANFVAKRWERGDTMFLRAAFDDMVARKTELDGRPVEPKQSFWRRGG
jgi:hypothetical protein